MRFASPVVVSLLVAPLIASGDEKSSFTGNALSPSGSPLYSEHHVVTGSCREGHWVPEKHTVEYRKPDSQSAFATKTLDYQAGLLLPEMTFRQPDFDEVMEVAIDNDQLSIDWTTPSGDRETFELTMPDRLVIDAGFDHFIRTNWEALTGGDSASFRFLGPTRGDHYGFVAEPADAEAFEADHEFRIRPDGLVTRFLVDPIYLGYNDEGFLTDFSGLTNIRKNRDRNFTAHIRYQQDGPPPCPLIP
jgi:hypothetical protein